MKSIIRWTVFLLILTVLQSYCFPSHAAADTYSIRDLGSDNGGHGGVDGIDDAGNVIVATACVGPTICYTVFLASGGAYISEGLPALNFDDGTACTPIAGAELGRCNNGFEAYALFADNSYGVLPGVFDGPDPLTDRLGGTNGTVFILLNGNGDIAFTDGTFEENYVAYDLTTRATPEPSSLLLLGTGMVGALASLRGLRPRKTDIEKAVP